MTKKIRIPGTTIDELREAVSRMMSAYPAYLHGVEETGQGFSFNVLTNGYNQRAVLAFKSNNEPYNVEIIIDESTRSTSTLSPGIAEDALSLLEQRVRFYHAYKSYKTPMKASMNIKTVVGN